MKRILIASLCVLCFLGPSLLAVEYDELIEKAQQRLAVLGYSVGTIDGKLGPKTIGAIKEFQRDQGLTVTGELDPKTLQQLEIVDNNPPSTSALSTPIITPMTPVTEQPTSIETTPASSTVEESTPGLREQDTGTFDQGTLQPLENVDVNPPPIKEPPISEILIVEHPTPDSSKLQEDLTISSEQQSEQQQSHQSSGEQIVGIIGAVACVLIGGWLLFRKISSKNAKVQGNLHTRLVGMISGIVGIGGCDKVSRFIHVRFFSIFKHSRHSTAKFVVFAYCCVLHSE